MTFLRATTAAICLLPTSLLAQDNPAAIVVMDGSGSMWGQIEGVAKITIAQQVMGELMTTLPADLDLGLTVYGHRRKGDCSDIETVVLPGPDTRAAITTAVNGITPKGKTPMADAVVAAAKALRHTEEAATVILVSDGIETCVPDVCAVAKELEATGVDFTAHVVGFDVTDPEALAQFQCMAEATGGKFLAAANADELGNALTEVAAAPPPEPEPQPVQVTIVATDGKNGPVINTPLIWDLTGGDTAIHDDHSAASLKEHLLEGEYTVSVLRPEDEASAEMRFGVGSVDKRVVLELPEFKPPATVSGPQSAPAGSMITVDWTGPNAKDDFIAAVDPETNKWITYNYTREGSPLSLQMPPKPGAYEIRYILSDGRKPLASQPITGTDVTATLSAPDELVAGATVPVDWTGPDYKGDFISVTKPDDEKWITYTYTREGSPLMLQMPGEPGDYELVYTMSQDRTIIHRAPISVAALAYGLDADATANAGAKLSVTWTGPGYDGDYITVAGTDTADDKYVNYTYTREGNPLNLVMPGEAGAYEIRYVLGQDRSVQARTTVEVKAVGATVSGPATGPIGGKIIASWTGPAGDGDYLTIVTPDAPDGDYGPYAYTRDGSDLTLNLPANPGTYELRYVADTNPMKVLARTPLTVEDVPVTITAPASAAAGSSIEVTWTGPGHPRDYLAVGNAASEYITYTYAEQGTSLSLAVPEEPGDYEIRYFLDVDNKLLASVPLKVE
ncbi:MAG: VWA domain-containing protein [Shimia sp.]|uniref:vWA domain-containing protein n=1 Tax=Shimia sp. TaxID=1954381 RepID=UPI0025E281F0|nr:VWA domain-containing protein [Shimia sp.]MCH2066837.1 VWA domain-containing protein [Shimia sp.]